MMKSLVLLVAGVTLSQLALADIEDTAKVLKVDQAYKSARVPRESCWDDQVPVNNGQGQGSSMNAGTVIGGLTGAIVGNQIGKGNGNKAAIAVGAVTGAMVGNNINNNGQNNVQQTQTVRRCKTVIEENQVPDGYMVTYAYHGMQDTAHISYDPGATLRLRIGPK